jgi:putative SOS response-associated peptidase YedK
MCYSAMLQQSRQAYREFFHLSHSDQGPDWQVRCFPHQPFPVVLEQDGQRQVRLMNYSLVPSWSKESRPRFATYNARLDSLTSKPTWREPVRTQRCLVGISSFFENCYQGEYAGKVVEFRKPNGHIWAAAGLWNEWQDQRTGERIQTFAITTTEPSPFIEKAGHDRSPVFLPEDQFASWLKPVPRKAEDVVAFLISHHQPLVSANILVERSLKPGWEQKK